MSIEFSTTTGTSQAGSFSTDSRVKAWVYSTLLGHRVVTQFLTPSYGIFGLLTYRRRFVLKPRAAKRRNAENRAY